VFVNAGWVGGGNIPQIFESMVKESSSADLGIQVVFLTGQNKALEHHILALSQHASFPVKVMGHTSEIERLMQASDVMVSKLGALTTFEALSCRLPIIADAVTTPMPQELQTASFLERHNAGIMLKKPDEIISALRSLIQFPEKHRMLQHAAVQHGCLGASDLIAKDVLQYLAASSI
jgi:processive 1,2-diacylglycerol beta-glucosyltransferase